MFVLSRIKKLSMLGSVPISEPSVVLDESGLVSL